MNKIALLITVLVLSTPFQAIAKKSPDVLEDRGYIMTERPSVPYDVRISDEVVNPSPPFVNPNAEMFRNTRKFNNLGREEVVKARPDHIPDTRLFRDPPQ